uniref:L-lactate dehydrogenase A chain n=1 Tax=Prolemur simus TaxID=1328070 RepID=A0A8C9AP87_PROSS
MATVRHELIQIFTSEEAVHHSKISIVGTGSVGMACAISILLKSSSCCQLLLLPIIQTPRDSFCSTNSNVFISNVLIANTYT